MENLLQSAKVFGRSRVTHRQTNTQTKCQTLVLMLRARFARSIKEPPARTLSENTSQVYITPAVLRKLNYSVYIKPNIKCIWSKLSFLFVFTINLYLCFFEMVCFTYILLSIKSKYL